MDIEQPNRLWRAFRRRPLWTLVSSAVILIFGIIVLLASGYLGEKGRQAASPQLSPSMQKEESPPKKDVPPPPDIFEGHTSVAKKSGANVIEALIQKCSQMGPILTRRPEDFIRSRISMIKTMRSKMPTYDLQSLLRVQPRPIAGLTRQEEIDQVIFTLNCLQSEGYLKTEKTSNTGSWLGAGVENLKIEFNEERWSQLEG